MALPGLPSPMHHRRWLAEVSTPGRFPPPPLTPPPGVARVRQVAMNAQGEGIILNGGGWSFAPPPSIASSSLLRQGWCAAPRRDKPKLRILRASRGRRGETSLPFRDDRNTSRPVGAGPRPAPTDSTGEPPLNGLPEPTTRRRASRRPGDGPGAAPPPSLSVAKRSDGQRSRSPRRTPPPRVTHPRTSLRPS